MSNNYPMKKSRLFEFLLVFLAVAFVVSTMAEKDKEPEATPTVAATAAPAANLPLRLGDPVPQFTLQNPDQTAVTYQPGKGPILVVLTATGCGECLERIAEQDVEAFDLAQKKGVEVWNMLVFHRPEDAKTFVEKHRPSAHTVLADPTSEISVKTLGGSDQTCWLLIDGEGKLAYRGPVDTAALEAALRKI